MHPKLLLTYGLTSLLIALVVSCSQRELQPAVLVKIDPAVQAEWESLLAEHPLPDGLSLQLSPEPAEEAHVQLIARIELLHRPPVSSGAADRSELSENSLLLDSRYYLPAVPIWDPRNSVDKSTAEEIGLISLEELALPAKALAVDGLRIDSPEYPFIEQKIMKLSWEENPHSGDEQPAVDIAITALRSWLADLQSEYSTPLDAEAPRITWIGSVGDIMVQRGVENLLIGKGHAGLQTVFQNTLPILQQQDLLIGNLEGAVTRRGVPVPKSFNFRFSPEVLPHLKAAGFDYFSITNNHCYDYGSSGFTDTLTHLKANGLLTSGAGQTPEEAYTPVRITLQKTDVTVLSVGAYPQEKNGFDGRRQAQVTDSRPGIVFSGPRFLETVKQTSSKDSIDIVVAHGGEEWHSHPSPEQRRFYRACIDAGADLVVAHHPHVLQGMEAYEGGLIAYSLGNFIFPGMYVMPNAEESIILSAGYHKNRLVYLVPYPVKIDNRVIDLDKPEGPILPRFMELTKQLNPE